MAIFLVFVSCDNTRQYVFTSYLSVATVVLKHTKYCVCVCVAGQFRQVDPLRPFVEWTRSPRLHGHFVGGTKTSIRYIDFPASTFIFITSPGLSCV